MLWLCCWHKGAAGGGHLGAASLERKCHQKPDAQSAAAELCLLALHLIAEDK